ncbi:hypothetical protein [Streptomyces sp. NPDC005322]|uniref:hypothetical protein n=1 Tax=Streptomyces sp. NPDC005322 TaxID=3157032 RepID=UPI0033BA1279
MLTSPRYIAQATYRGEVVGEGQWPAILDEATHYAVVSALPLQARRLTERTGFTAFEDRPRRLHVLLDAYGYDGDRSAFAAVVAARARTNADVIDRMAADGDPVYTALLPVAADLRQAALEVEALPDSFWTPANC